MTVKQSAENAIFNYPKDTQNSPSMQETADLFQNVRHTRASLSLLIADTLLSYTAGAANYVASGDVIEADEIIYDVAASGATDHNFATAGGVKLYKRAEPIAILIAGSSNSAGKETATGGDRDILGGVHAWDSDSHSGAYATGTQFVKPAFGSNPLDFGAGLGNSIGLQIALARHRESGRPVYFVIWALGGLNPESFITSATRTTNGWTIPGGEEDMTLHYANLQTALAAIPGSKTEFDELMFYQTQGTSAGRVTYQDQIAAILDDLDTEGLTSKAKTQIAAFISTPGTSNRETHQVSWYDEAKRRPNLAVGDTAGLDTTDGTHFSGNACTAFGRRAHNLLSGAQSMTGQALILSDEDNADTRSYTKAEHSNGDSATFGHYDGAASAVVIASSNLGTVRAAIDGTQVVSFSAGGILFPGGTDRLEAYERGNDIDLAIADAASGGNVSATAWTMRQQLVGRDVTVYGRSPAIDTTGMTGGNGLFFTGLPFGIVDQQALRGGGWINADSFTLSSGYTWLTVEAVNGTDYFQIRENGSGVDSQALTVASITTTVSKLRSFGFTYRTSDPIA